MPKEAMGFGKIFGIGGAPGSLTALFLIGGGVEVEAEPDISGLAAASPGHRLFLFPLNLVNILA